MRRFPPVMVALHACSTFLQRGRMAPGLIDGEIDLAAHSFLGPRGATDVPVSIVPASTFAQRKVGPQEGKRIGFRQKGLGFCAASERLGE
jgi:hypothetical protein